MSSEVNETQIRKLEKARSSLREILSDCYGDTTHDEFCECSIDCPSCEEMRLRSSLREIDSILSPMPQTTRPDRLCNISERIYFEEFLKLCERQTGINRGFGLADILVAGLNESPRAPTLPEARAMAAVVQWLGTPCGMAFISTCERKISAEQELNSSIRNLAHVRPNGRSKLQLDDVIESLLRRSVDRYITDEWAKRDCRAKLQDTFITLVALVLYCRGPEFHCYAAKIYTGKDDLGKWAPDQLERLMRLLEPVIETKVEI